MININVHTYFITAYRSTSKQQLIMFKAQESEVYQQWDLMTNNWVKLVGWNLCMKVCTYGFSINELGNPVIAAPCSDQYDPTQEWEVMSVS